MFRGCLRRVLLGGCTGFFTHFTHPQFQIEEQVRVVVCTRTRLDETAIFLQRGPVKRREGERRRIKIGKKKGHPRKDLEPRTLEPDKDSVRINLEDLGDRLEDFLTKPINS